MLTNIVSSANVDVLDGISAISASWARQYTHYVCTCTWLHVWNRVRLLLHFNRNKKMPNLLKMLHLSPLWLFSIILKHMIIVHQSVSWQFNELCADTLSNCVGVKGGSEFGLQFCLEVMHLEQIFLSDNKHTSETWGYPASAEQSLPVTLSFGGFSENWLWPPINMRPSPSAGWGFKFLQLKYEPGAAQQTFLACLN